MEEEKPREPTIAERLDLLKNDLFVQIDHNSATIDSHLPVFFGTVVSFLDGMGKDLTDPVYDEFIDEITFRLLEANKDRNDPEFLEKVCTFALKAKRVSSARMGIDLVVGIKLLNGGEYQGAITHLKDYAHLDGIIASSIAYCYYMLSLKEIADNVTQTSALGEMELLAREQMLFMAQKRLPLAYLPHLQEKDEAMITRAFWLMITCSLDWFPSEPGFLLLGIEKAKRDGNKEIRKELLKIANERFFNDMFFLRETYYLNLEERDPIGAAGVVKQMITQYPDHWEPLYYGIKLSLLTNTRTTFETFRKLSVTKGIPPHLLFLFDLSFSVVSRDRETGARLLKEGKQRYPDLVYFLHPLEYIIQDISSDDLRRSKRAKKTAIDAIELFCLNTLRHPSHGTMEN